MEKAKTFSNGKIGGKETKTSLPFVIAVIGVLFMIVALFLPYITAVGDMAEYVDKYPDVIEVESLNMTARDMEKASFVTVSKIINAAYGEDDAAVAKVIVFLFCGLFALTALFVILKKHIAVIVFNLLTCGVFFFLNSLMKSDFIGENKYGWGIGYYLVLFAAIAIFVGTIWFFVIKIGQKRHEKETSSSKSVD